MYIISKLLTYNSLIIRLLFLVFSLGISAKDIGELQKDSLPLDNTCRFHYKQLIAPAALIGIGAASFGAQYNKDIDAWIATDYRTYADDYLRFAPALGVYALNMAGIKGKHNFIDRTIILATATAIMGISVQGLKTIVHSPRPLNPDEHDSFPSGHTAIAFMGAEFMRKEYANVSPWIGVVGYGMAISVGALRVCNHQHWFNDVLLGAGIGILSTKAAYWLYPQISKMLGRKGNFAIVAPYYNKYNSGLSLSMTF